MKLVFVTVIKLRVPVAPGRDNRPGTTPSVRPKSPTHETLSEKCVNAKSQLGRG
jgi:hypothetical protein